MDKITNKTRETTARMNGPRGAASGAVVALALTLCPLIAAHAAADQTGTSAVSAHAKAFGETVRRDTKAVGATFKEGAHRVAVAAKAVAHEIAQAARRSAAESRAALRGKQSATPAG
jgi:hypothetical protein